MNTCRVPRCRQPYDTVYLGKEICWRHWDKLCEDIPKLRAKLGLPPLKESDDAPDQHRE